MAFFDSLPAAKPDQIMALMAAFKADPRSAKIDLGAGVYKDGSGQVPMMDAIKQAERRLLESQTTKTYVSPAGDMQFNAEMARLLLGPDAPLDRIATAQTPGGSGALRLVAGLLNTARPGAQVWLPDPTWPNHPPLLTGGGLTVRTYPYFDAESGTVDFSAMIDALTQAPAGDVVLLHGCCHNPTGADLSLDQWAALTTLCIERGLFPFIDMAYQGFGDGLEEDAAGVRYMAARVPEIAIAASCSKNFAMYRERVGAAIVICPATAQQPAVQATLAGCARSIWSMPPDHGAAAVRIVLEDAALRGQWKGELAAMRARMLTLRDRLADALQQAAGSDRYAFLRSQRGMFSCLPLDAAQLSTLREAHGIYIVGGGRINIAGLPEDKLDLLAQAVVAVERG